MLYYEAACLVPPEAVEAHKSDREAFRSGVRAQTERFHRKTRAGKVFVAEMDRRQIHLAMAIEAAQDVRGLAEAFVSELGVHAHSALTYDEITLQDYAKAARRADGEWIQNDEDFVPDHYQRFRRYDFPEFILKKDIPRKSRRAKAAGLLLADLAEELDRIAQVPGGTKRPVGGHPVHYCLRINDCGVRDEAVKLLLAELVEAGRLPGRRYVELKLDDHTTLEKEEMLRAFQTAEDNALVVCCEQEGPMGEYASSSTGALDYLCQYAAQYRHSVLLVLCLRRENTGGARYLLQAMDDASFVEIHETSVDADQAKKWLRARARALGAQNTATLTRQISGSKTYVISQLISMVNLWLGQFLRSEVYPQYTHLTPAHRESKPVGSAYGQLMEMVGLEQAKALLERALSLHRMRGEYARQGVPQAVPTMHMVFSGNPGTAKTTVARLFAQVMRDNGLLQAGELYEVGRANLVGRYVGHTAPLVKDYFKKAKGSVLFIDEAYSLLDDRSGMYGDEAINTIVQEMERLRNEVVVIFAGYRDPMEDFLQRNPGLRSRIAFHVDFPDYSQQELYAILRQMMKEQGLHLARGAGEKARQVLRAAAGVPNFGNGRYVRNMLQRARMNQAARLAGAGGAVPPEQLCLLQADDFEEEAWAPARKTAIGF